MSLLRFLDWKQEDIVAFVMSGVLGYLVGASLSVYSWHGYVGALVAYHIFLGWLLFSADGRNRPVLSTVGTIVTHLACLAVVISLVSLRTHSVIWLYMRYGVALLAFFEKEWVFGGVAKKNRGNRTASGRINSRRLRTLVTDEGSA
jgi:hypothetical protein